jgi:hypothetical protein
MQWFPNRQQTRVANNRTFQPGMFRAGASPQPLTPQTEMTPQSMGAVQNRAPGGAGVSSGSAQTSGPSTLGGGKSSAPPVAPQQPMITQSQVPPPGGVQYSNWQGLDPTSSETQKAWNYTPGDGGNQWRPQNEEEWVYDIQKRLDSGKILNAEDFSKTKMWFPGNQELLDAVMRAVTGLPWNYTPQAAAIDRRERKGAVA